MKLSGVLTEFSSLATAESARASVATSEENLFKLRFPFSVCNLCILIPQDCFTSPPLQWHHNEHNGVSNHRHRGCLTDRLFWHRPKKTPKFRVTGLCGGNSPVAGEFPSQRVSNAENVSIWWRHHGDIRMSALMPKKKALRIVAKWLVKTTKNTTKRVQWA